MKMVTKCGPLGRPEAAHPPNSLSAPCKDINCWVWIWTLSTLHFHTVDMHTIHIVDMHTIHTATGRSQTWKKQLMGISRAGWQFSAPTGALSVQLQFFLGFINYFSKIVSQLCFCHIGSIGGKTWVQTAAGVRTEADGGRNQCWIAKHYFHRANYWYYVYCANYFVHAVRNQSQCQ